MPDTEGVDVRRGAWLSFWFGVGGFLVALQAARLAGVVFWGGPDRHFAQILFSLGFSNGRQFPVHLFYLTFIPLLSWFWIKLCECSLAARSRSGQILFGALQGAALTVLALVSRNLGWDIVWIAGVAAAIAWAKRRWGAGADLFSTRPAWSLGAALSLSAGLAALYGWLFPGWHPPFQIDLYHEADQLGPAMDYLAGKVPYRDIYIPQGLIHNVLKPAAAFIWLGGSVAAKKFVDALTAPLGYLAFALLARAVLRRTALWLLVIFGLPLLFPYFPDRHFFGALALAALAWPPTREMRPGSLVRFAGAGMMASLQFWHSLELGVYVVAAALLVFAVEILSKGWRIRRSWIPLASFLGGWTVVSSTLLISLAHNHAAGPLFFQFYQRLTSHQKIEGIAYHVYQNNPQDVQLFLWYLPLWIQYGAVSWLVAGRRLEERERWTGVLLTAAAVFFFYSALAHGDFEHLSFCAPYSFLLGFWCWERLWDESVAAAGRSLSSLLPLFIVAFGLLGIGTKLNELQYFGARFRIHAQDAAKHWAHSGWKSSWHWSRIGGVLLDAETLNVCSEANRWSSPQAPLLNLTPAGAIGFVCGRSNPTRYYLPDYLYSAAQEQEVLNDLSGQTKEVLILTPLQLDDLKDRAQRPLALLAGYLRARYDLAWSGAHYALWKQKT